MLICPHEFDVALCGIIVKNVALSLSLVGRYHHHYFQCKPYFFMFLYMLCMKYFHFDKGMRRGGFGRGGFGRGGSAFGPGKG